jgi:hypothetical protein
MSLQIPCRWFTSTRPSRIFRVSSLPSLEGLVSRISISDKHSLGRRDRRGSHRSEDETCDELFHVTPFMQCAADNTQDEPGAASGDAGSSARLVT